MSEEDLRRRVGRVEDTVKSHGDRISSLEERSESNRKSAEAINDRVDKIGDQIDDIINRLGELREHMIRSEQNRRISKWLVWLVVSAAGVAVSAARWLWP